MVVDVRDKPPISVLQYRKVGGVRRVERRAHVRVEVLLNPLEVVVLDEETGNQTELPGPVVVNISAGGLELVSRQPLVVGSRLRITLELPLGFGWVRTEAGVVHCTAAGENVLRKWRLGVAFWGIGPRDQDRLAGFVLSQQQLLRRRGLL